MATPAVFLLLRMALEPAGSGASAPYALNFLAVMLATVMAGWRSGLLATGFGQALTWAALMAPRAPLMSDTDAAVGFAVATGSQLLIVLIMALYQREVDRSVAQRDHRIAVTEEARREINHRIANYLQTTLALIRLQQQRSEEASVQLALEQVANRIGAVAVATEHLSRPEDPLSTIRLNDHLTRLCSELRKGLTWDGVQLDCDIADIAVDSDRATTIGLVVNELVTNALKHAFREGQAGVVAVSLRSIHSGLELRVSDDGRGMAAAPSRGGLGTRLIKTFVRELGAEHAVATGPNGTVHTVRMPG